MPLADALRSCALSVADVRGQPLHIVVTHFRSGLLRVACSQRAAPGALVRLARAAAAEADSSDDERGDARATWSNTAVLLRSPDTPFAAALARALALRALPAVDCLLVSASLADRASAHADAADADAVDVPTVRRVAAAVCERLQQEREASTASEPEQQAH